MNKIVKMSGGAASVGEIYEGAEKEGAVFFSREKVERPNNINFDSEGYFVLAVEPIFDLWGNFSVFRIQNGSVPEEIKVNYDYPFFPDAIWVFEKK